MVFSSPEFVFVFLPIVLAISCLIGQLKRGTQATLAWLSAASIFFYGVWRPHYILVLGASIFTNWWMAKWIRQAQSTRLPLTVGILLNLSTIGLFKYADFVLANVNWLFRSEFPELGLLLPLGISFFTFQQIAFLVDTAKGRAGKTGLLEYVFFVSFFPQLIAGPIVHHRHILPKIREKKAFEFDAESVLTGIYVFVIGFAKKVVIADSLALAATAIFDAADAGHTITTHDAILGTLSYTFQIYFDFSGYTDMAIGLGLMFGLQLPKNFDSPYRATGIIDFWRRWHMTLSEFLRDYVYIPLGGNRHGSARRYVNLLLTMLIGGLWHGASWTFVLWGGAHGALLAVNHALRKLFPKPHQPIWRSFYEQLGWAVTLTCVALTWVPFRSTTWEGVVKIYSSILGGLAGATSTPTYAFDGTQMPYLFKVTINASSFSPWAWLMAAACLSFTCPNTWVWMQRFQQRDHGPFRLLANTSTVVTFGLAAYTIVYHANRVTEFIYFNF